MITTLAIRMFLALAFVSIMAVVGMVLFEAAGFFGAGLFLLATPFLFAILARLLRKPGQF